MTPPSYLWSNQNYWEVAEFRINFKDRANRLSSCMASGVQWSGENTKWFTRSIWAKATINGIAVTAMGMEGVGLRDKQVFIPIFSIVWFSFFSIRIRHLLGTCEGRTGEDKSQRLEIHKATVKEGLSVRCFRVK